MSLTEINNYQKNRLIGSALKHVSAFPGVACLGLRYPPSCGADDHSGPLPARPGTGPVDPLVPEGGLVSEDDLYALRQDESVYILF